MRNEKDLWQAGEAVGVCIPVSVYVSVKLPSYVRMDPIRT